MKDVRKVENIGSDKIGIGLAATGLSSRKGDLITRLRSHSRGLLHGLSSFSSRPDRHRWMDWNPPSRCMNGIIDAIERINKKRVYTKKIEHVFKMVILEAENRPYLILQIYKKKNVSSFYSSRRKWKNILLDLTQINRGRWWGDREKPFWVLQ